MCTFKNIDCWKLISFSAYRGFPTPWSSHLDASELQAHRSVDVRLVLDQWPVTGLYPKRWVVLNRNEPWLVLRVLLSNLSVYLKEIREPNLERAGLGWWCVKGGDGLEHHGKSKGVSELTKLSWSAGINWLRSGDKVARTGDLLTKYAGGIGMYLKHEFKDLQRFQPLRIVGYEDFRKVSWIKNYINSRRFFKKEKELKKLTCLTGFKKPKASWINKLAVALQEQSKKRQWWLDMHFMEHCWLLQWWDPRLALTAVHSPRE